MCVSNHHFGNGVKNWSFWLKHDIWLVTQIWWMIIISNILLTSQFDCCKRHINLFDLTLYNLTLFLSKYKLYHFPKCRSLFTYVTCTYTYVVNKAWTALSFNVWNNIYPKYPVVEIEIKFFPSYLKCPSIDHHIPGYIKTTRIICLLKDLPQINTLCTNLIVFLRFIFISNFIKINFEPGVIDFLPSQSWPNLSITFLLDVEVNTPVQHSVPTFLVQ